ncbi:MAG: hypothetical protein ACOX37_07840 [Bacillota bacterium]
MLRIMGAGDSALDGFLRRAGIRSGEGYRARWRPLFIRCGKKGDRALVEFTRRYDGAGNRCRGLAGREEAEIEEAYQLVEPEFLAALRQIHESISRSST